MTTCTHQMMTLTETTGLGSWQPVEVYTCDSCGAKISVPVQIEVADEDYFA